MSNRGEESVRWYEKGFSCSQAIFSAYGEPFGIDRELAFRIAAAFGGGMARRGEICGALVGAMMVIGLKFGMVEVGDLPAKEKTYARVHELLSRFRARSGSILCRDLLGADLSTPEGALRNKEEKLSVRLCPQFVRDTADILEDLLL